MWVPWRCWLPPRFCWRGSRLGLVGLGLARRVGLGSWLGLESRLGLGPGLGLGLALNPQEME